MFNKVTSLLIALCPKINVQYLVLDTAYGTVDYQKLVEAVSLDIISKFKSIACLYFPFEAVAEDDVSKGRPRIYGQKVNTAILPELYLKETKIEEVYKTETYQFKAFAKNTFGQKLLNIVVQRKTRITDGKVSINIWRSAAAVSTDLKLDYKTLLEYYSLRFQIEFDSGGVPLRDAKQHFGLSDFKNYKRENLTNFVNLSFTMCLIAKVQLAYYRELLNAPKLSIIDLKLIYKARFTAKNILKLIRNQPSSIFNDQFCEQFMPQDLINAA